MLGLTTTKKLREYDQLLQEQQYQLETAQAQIEDIKKISGVYARRLADVHEAAYHFSDGVEDGDGYHEANAGRFDMNLTDKRTIQKQCVEIFSINPYAKRIIEMMTDFALGDEIKYHIDKEYEATLEPIITRMVHDYDNNFNRNLEAEIKELNLLGEKIEPVAETTKSRVVKFGHVDPRLVTNIDRNPENQKRFWRVYTDPQSKDYSDESYVYGVMQDIDGRLGVSTDQISGKGMEGNKYIAPCFLWQINRLPSQNRGYSELMPMLDALDLMDQFIFQVAERSLLLYHFIMKITLKGSSKEEVSRYTPPDPRVSSVFVCNDRVEAEFMTPDLKSTDTETFIRTITRFSLAGAGIPEHWVVSGDNTNRATAREQSQPIEKRLIRKQGQVKMILEDRTRYQIEQYLPNASEDDVYKMTQAIHWELPSVSGVDRKLTAEVLGKLAEALVMGVQQIGVDPESAKTSFVKIANEYGLNLTESTETPGQDNEFGLKKGMDLLDKLEQLKLEMKGKDGKGAPAKNEPAGKVKPEAEQKADD